MAHSIAGDIARGQEFHPVSTRLVRYADRNANFVRVAGAHNGLEARHRRAPPERSGAFGAPASDGVGGSGGAKPPGLVGHLVVVAALLTFGAFGPPVVDAQQPDLQVERDPAPANESISPEAKRETGSRLEIPSNIEVSGVLKDVVLELLQKSPTFARQCERIAAARYARILVLATPPNREVTAPRARSTITRHVFGALRATIEIPIAGEYAELIGHELEHVIEQVDGLNLATLSRAGAAGIIEVQDGVYESVRAAAAGRLVAEEALGNSDPMRAAATSTMTFVLRAIRSRAARPSQPTLLWRR